MADKPTREQQLVIDNRGGKLLVSAAAGSGKTKVLVDRVLKYIMDPVDPANIDDFLIITFTKDAAAELRLKIAKALTEKIAEDPSNMHLQHQFQRLYLAKISTVHSFCSDILREYAYALDISGDFRMLEENETKLLREGVIQKILEEAYRDIEPGSDFAAFVDTQGMGRTDAQVPKLVIDFYKQACCHLDPEGWLDQCIENANVENVTDAANTVWGKYLMEDLFSYLRQQSEAFRNCAALCDQAGAPEKYGAFLLSVASILGNILQKQTWDELVTSLRFKFPTIPRKTKADPLEGEAEELWERVKFYYDKFKDEYTKIKIRPFCNLSDQVIRDLVQSTASVRGLVSLVRQFTKSYTQLKKNMHVADFGDLEHYTLDLLLGKSRSGQTVAARDISARFREIMVDEYQDSNEVQDSIFGALTQQRQNLFMVGDVKQSIYRFRLADPGIFLNRYNHYPPSELAAPGEGRKIILSNNFRSCNAVVDAVNDVFEACMSVAVGDLDYGAAERLVAGKSYAEVSEPEVEFHCIQTERNAYACEAEFVANRILELTDGTHMIRDKDQLRPIRFGDIVILLRSPRTNGPIFRYVLGRKGINTITRGGVDILQTDEVIWLRNLLLTISNPRQDVPLVATMIGPVFGFTADELASIRYPNREKPFYDLLLLSDTEKSKSFVSLLDHLRHISRIQSLPELLEQVFYLTKMDSIYGAMEDGDAKKDNLQAFYQYVVKYDSGRRSDLQQLLEHLTLCEADGLKIENTQTADCVTMLSIHKSKGLEYPVVFLSCLGKQFGGNDKDEVLTDQELGLGLNCLDESTRSRYPTISARAIKVKQEALDLSEEMRVLYVAMTRAKDRLIMTYADRFMKNAILRIANRMDLCNRDLINARATCPGDWILYAALRRTEAGQLFAMGDRPLRTEVSNRPWYITATEMVWNDENEESVSEPVAETVSEEVKEKIRHALEFSYPYMAATKAPSKQTATQRKGRVLDDEAEEGTPKPRNAARTWRKPSFVSGDLGAVAHGNAVHAAMQYLRFACCQDEESIAMELKRIVSEGYMTQEQARMVNCSQIAAFFQTELGQKLRSGKNVLREFKFSILDRSESYGNGLEGEKVLLQGVVDAALIEADGITVIDFKTDRVSPETLSQVTERYRIQVETYAEALSRIYQLPVREKVLYFFGLPGFVSL